MKHLKTYENNNIDLSVGNYVVLHNDKNWLGDILNCLKIERNQNYPLIDIEYIVPISNLIESSDINLKDIDRMSTKDEIENYETIKNQIIYNL